MDAPLNIIEGKDGSLQDIHGRAMIMVFNPRRNGVQARAKQTDHADGTEQTRSASQPLIFITTLKAEDRDKTARKLIRSHVMKNYRRKEKNAARKSRSRSPGQINRAEQNSIAVSSSIKPLASSAFPKQPSGNLDPFVSYPVPMRPYMYRLVHHYLSVIADAMYPREPDWKRSPTSASLFSMAMSDSALFHMILCISALYVDILSGNPESRESVFHKLEAIRRIKTGLQTYSAISDSLIGTVACLAKTEFILGNHEMWAIHRNGLIKMVEVRGGIQMLNEPLRGKVCIADLVGCVESDLPPQFPFFDGSDPPNHAIEPPERNLCRGFKNIVSVFSFDLEFTSALSGLQALTEMVVLTNTTKNTPGLVGLDHIAAKLRHRLLSCSSARITATQQDLVREACRIGLLVYFKTILRNFPSRGRSYHTLIEKLTWCIDNIENITAAENRHLAELVLWLLFLGGVVDANGPSEAWFVAEVSNLSSILRLESWHSLKPVLMNFLWAETMHEGPFFAFWNKVLATRNVLL